MDMIAQRTVVHYVKLELFQTEQNHAKNAQKGNIKV